MVVGFVPTTFLVYGGVCSTYMTIEHLLATCISFRTVTGDKSVADAFVSWVKETVQPLPLYVREYTYAGLPSLVITPTRKKHARIWLVAHFDVVAGPDTLFHARREEEKLVGRGAIDMKFAIACYLALLLEIGTHAREYDIGVMLTPDEEWGNDSAVKYLLEQVGYTGDVAFLPDGSGWWKFEECAKGIMGVRVTTSGISAHGSKPWLGRSAISELMEFLHEVQGEVQKRFTNTDAHHWYTTLNVGEIEGGVAFNVVAPTASATMDIRYVAEKDRRTLERLFARLTKKYKNTVCEITRSEKPYGIGKVNGYAKTFSRIAKDMHGISCVWVRAHGASDARFFHAVGIPTLLIGPRGGGSHSDHEWVDMHDVVRYYGVLKEFVEDVGKR